MQSAKVSAILVENKTLQSKFLQREVKVDFYLLRHVSDPSQMNLLLINDGQDMEVMGFEKILEQLYAEQSIEPLLCVAVHANAERKMEYGIAGHPNYKGQGAKKVQKPAPILHL